MPLQEDLRLATYADLKFLVVSEAHKLMNLKVKVLKLLVQFSSTVSTSIFCQFPWLYLHTFEKVHITLVKYLNVLKVQRGFISG